MLWIPITLAAAALQTARNAFQRSLTGALSPLGATYTRFLFGLPFAAFYALTVFAASDVAIPSPPAAFFAWATLGGVAQILGTSFLLRLFQLRNFSTGIAFSKSEVLQVALFGLLVLGRRDLAARGGRDRGCDERPLLLARETGALDLRSVVASLGAKPALLGLGTGAAFAVAAVGFRAASLSLALPFVASAAATLVTSLFVQSLLMTPIRFGASPDRSKRCSGSCGARCDRASRRRGVGMLVHRDDARDRRVRPHARGSSRCCSATALRCSPCASGRTCASASAPRCSSSRFSGCSGTGWPLAAC